MELREIEQYITSLDNVDKGIIDKRVADNGLIETLDKQLVYLDCSRIYKNGMRAMQTIGYPYQRKISTYLYLLDKCTPDAREFYEEKLLKLHEANLAYEQENPPIWYGGKKAKKKWDDEHKSDKLPRKRNAKQPTIPGFGREVSNAERLKRLNAQFGSLTFKLKPPKKDG